MKVKASSRHPRKENMKRKNKQIKTQKNRAFLLQVQSANIIAYAPVVMWMATA